MAENNPYKISERALKVLVRYGEIEELNLVRKWQVYDDAKIRIEGILPLNLLSDEPYTDIYIALKVQSEQEIQRKQFGLTKHSEKNNWTVVYYWRKDMVQFYRPGRWEQYLLQLVQKSEDESQEARKFDRVPVDDSGLFPEISDV